MRRLLLGVVCVLAVLAASVVGLSAWQGRKAEAELRSRFHSEAGPYSVHVVREEYERGWLESRATWVIGAASKASGSQEGAPEEASGLRLVVEQRIAHGPLPGWSRLDWRPALAHVRSRMRLEAKGSEELGLLAELPALRGETRLSFDGSSRTKLSMKEARLERDGESLEWQGLEGEASFEKAEERARLLAEAPGLLLKEEGEELALEELLVYVDAEPGPASLPLGEERFALDALRFEGADSSLRARELEVVSTRSVEEGLLDLSAALDIAELARSDRDYGPLSFELALRRLDASALSKLGERASEPGAKSSAAAQSKELLPELLGRSPELELALGLGAEAEAIRSRVDLRVDGEHPAIASGGSGALLATLHGRVELSVPHAFVERALAERAAVTARAEAARTQIHGLVSQGLLTLRDGRLELEARYEAGRLTVNGRRVQVSDLLELAVQGMKSREEAPPSPQPTSR